MFRLSRSFWISASCKIVEPTSGATMRSVAGSPFAARSPQTTAISSRIVAPRVPVRCGRVLRGVGFSVVKTDLFFFGFAGIVGNVIHDAAVRKKRFRRHSFFAATDHFVEILEVLHHKRCLTLSGRQLRIERLAEAALVKVVDRHGALGRDIGRRVAFHVMTFTQYGDAAFAGSNERREFFASAAILHEHVVRCEQIRRFVRREVTIAKEGVQRVELLNEQEHGMRFENV